MIAARLAARRAAAEAAAAQQSGGGDGASDTFAAGANHGRGAVPADVEAPRRGRPPLALEVHRARAASISASRGSSPAPDAMAAPGAGGVAGFERRPSRPSSDVPPQAAPSTCAICEQPMGHRRHVKTLPCFHSFHFECIDEYHRKKMHIEKDMGLPCYTCGAASHKSIAALVEERRKHREAEKQAAAKAVAAEKESSAETVVKAVEAAAQVARIARERSASQGPGRRRGGALAALAQASRAGLGDPAPGQ